MRRAVNEFLVAEHISLRGQTVNDIAAGLLGGLDRSRGRVERWKLDFQIDLKLIKGTIQAADRHQDVVTTFVDAVERAWDSVQGTVDGIFLVIDEIDRVAETPGISTFLKVSTELLSARGLEHILLVPVGMVGVQELLKAEHESVGRVFEVIHVPMLTVDESMAIVERALKSTAVTIPDDVNAKIAEYAGGFPHPVHLIGSEAFDADADGTIGFDDLEAGIESVVTEKWKEEFDAAFIDAGSGNNRDIIKTMAGYNEGPDVPLQYVCDRMGVTQPQISSNLAELMRRDVVVRATRGVYRFKEPLFRVYVEYLNVLGTEPVQHRPRKRKR